MLDLALSEALVGRVRSGSKETSRSKASAENSTKLSKPLTSRSKGSADESRRLSKETRRGSLPRSSETAGDEREGQRLQLHRKPCEKDAHALSLISESLRKSRFGQSLEEPARDELCQSMDFLTFGNGEDVVVEGEAGRHFFVVHEGLLEVLVDSEQHATVGSGDSFGEIALLYDCPRTATVRSSGDASVWATSGELFRRVIREHAEKRRAESQQFLNSVRLFDGIPALQKDRLGELAVPEAVAAGRRVVTQGQAASAIYFVRKGELHKVVGGTVDKSGQLNGGSTVMTLRPGDCFGHRDVLFGEKVTATVTTETDCELLSISLKHIKEVLCEESLSTWLERAFALSVLRTVSVISQLSFRNLHQIVEAMQIVSYGAGDAVEAGKRLVIVLDGELSGVGRGSSKSPAAGSALDAIKKGGAAGAEGAVSTDQVVLQRGQTYGESAFVELVGSGGSGSSTCKQKLVAGLANVKAGAPGARLMILGKQELSKALKGMGLANLGANEKAEERLKKTLLARKVPIFCDLSEDQINGFAGSFVLRKYMRGARVIEKGEMGNSLFIIASGELTVFKDSGDNVILGQGSFLGERALILDQVRSATIEVTSRTAELWALDRPAFQRAVSAKMREELVRRIQIQDTPVSLGSLVHLRFIGVGGFGSVRLVEHKEMAGLRFALKHVALKDGKVPDGVRQECALLSQADNPFIVRLVQSFETDNGIYILTELITGGSLHQHLPTLGVMKREVSRFYLGTVVLALEALHDRGIVYRDLKPENIMLDGQGYGKLIDLGTAKKLDKPSAKTYTLIGTVAYVSPEAVRGRGYGLEADLWAAGVLAFQLSTGQEPFGEGVDEDNAVLEQILSAELSFPEEYEDSHGQQLISGLLRKEPWERLGSGSTGWEEVKACPFFALDEGSAPGALFRAIAGRELASPLVPGEECFRDEQVVQEEAEILGIPLGTGEDLGK